MTEKTHFVKEHRKARRMTQPTLAELVGSTTSEISKLERGDRRMTLEWLTRIGAALGVSPNDLLSPPGEQKIVPLTHHKISHRKLPVMGEVVAGAWLDVDPLQSDPIDWLDFTSDATLPAHHTYALRVRGTSLNKIAPDGAILVCVDLIGAGISIREGDLVIVEQSRDGDFHEVTAKRVRWANGHYELWPESMDPKWQTPIVLNGDDDGVTVAVKALVKHIVISP